MQIGKPGVEVQEYGIGERVNPKDNNAVVGYIQPAGKNPRWILWFTNKGDAIFHQKRGPTGAVLDKALEVKGYKE
jgi:hypothetical protein